jgi:hypothetical protein
MRVFSTEEIDRLYRDLIRRSARYAIVVVERELDDEVPGEFDGPTITLNDDYDAAQRAFYLAHSIGSIAEWSLDRERAQRIMQTLGEAKRNKATDDEGFERALADYLSFETNTWEFAVWLIGEIGHARFTAPFTNFGRADMESMRVFHTTGKAPVWRDFFAEWNEQVRRGERTVTAFAARPIPDFQAITIPKQEIVQEED